MRKRHQPYRIPITVWDFKNFDIEGLQKDLANADWDSSFAESEKINNIWEKWKETFMIYVNKHIPKKTSCPRQQTNQPWFNNELRSNPKGNPSIPESGKESQNKQHWTIYRLVRDQTRNTVKQAKKAYYKKRH